MTTGGRACEGALGMAAACLHGGRQSLQGVQSSGPHGAVRRGGRSQQRGKHSVEACRGVCRPVGLARRERRLVKQAQDLYLQSWSYIDMALNDALGLCGDQTFHESLCVQQTMLTGTPTLRK